MRNWVVMMMLMCLSLTLANAQAENWQAVLYVENADGGMRVGEIVVVDAEGIVGEWMLPREIYPAGDIVVREVEISPDNRFVALTTQFRNADQAPPVAIADLENGMCCARVEMPVPEPAAYTLAGFDPTGTQLALSYVGFDPAQTDVYAVGGLMIADAETGDVVEAVDMRDIVPDLEFAFWGLTGEWTAEGIQFVPSCYACEPPFQGEYWIWTPDSEAPFSDTSGIFFSIFGQRLDATNELLLFSQNQLYPYIEFDGTFPTSNIVQYYADGVLPPDALRGGFPVVYFNIDDYDLDDNQLDWISDGAAFLVSSPTQPNWIVTARGGGQRVVTVPLDSVVLTGTPDGWLSVQPAELPFARQLIHYVLVNDEYIAVDLGQVIGQVSVARAPQLGASLNDPLLPFAPVDPPQNGDVFLIDAQGGRSSALPCDTVHVTPRLVADQQGRVLPGSPNNLRYEPSMNSPIVGTIPENGVFTVLSDPICGYLFMWRYVDYLGVFGYTVEAGGTEYYTEPFPE